MPVAKRPIAAWTPGARTPPARPASTTIWLGDSAPGPTASLRTSKPRTDCGNCGIPDADPGVSCNAYTGIPAAISSAAPPNRNASGRRMIACESRAHIPSRGRGTQVNSGRNGWNRLTPRRP
jgi:hypothetical protein